jgi:hypothetical protein
MGGETYDLRLKSPFTSVISGPTGSGKTSLVNHLIENARVYASEPPHEILYCYGAWQAGFERMKGVQFFEGAENLEEKLPADGKQRWLILDDLINELDSIRGEIENVFTRLSHHRNVSVFFLTQNLFHKNLRMITLNAHYLFIFKNPRDRSQVAFLGRQLFPSNPNFLVNAYEDATKNPHSFILLDLKQNTKDYMRVIGNFISDDGDSVPLTVYSFK